MNRYNMGNITTNAMQTLNISGTAYASMKKRSIADAASALNAEKAEAEKTAAKAEMKERQGKIDARREELDKARLERTQAQTELYKARASDLTSNTEARNLRTERIRNIGTPQSKEIAKKIDSDLGWYEEFYKEISKPLTAEELTSTIKELTGGKSDASKDV